MLYNGVLSITTSAKKKNGKINYKNMSEPRYQIYLSNIQTTLLDAKIRTNYWLFMLNTK